MPVIFSFTKKGATLAQRIAAWYTDADVRTDYSAVPFKAQVAEVFSQTRCLIFVGALGIALRAVAGLITTKDKDPAVIVVDECGKFVIPALSGHLGGANQIALALAEKLDAQPVVTTATDLNGVFAVDEWARQSGLQVVNVPSIKHVSSALLEGEVVGVCTDQQLEGTLPGYLTYRDARVGIVISEDYETLDYSFEHTLYLRPRTYVIGAGCRKGADVEVFERSMNEFLTSNSIDHRQIVSLASIDLKQNEPALVEYVHKYHLVFETYSAEELAACEGEFTGSDFVKSTTGVDSVCERAAAKCALTSDILIRKTVLNSSTFAVAKKQWKGSFCTL